MLGIDLVQKENINRVIVFGDSKQIIQKVRNGHIDGAINCSHLHKRIIKMSSSLEISYYHILRKNNSLADKMANKGVKNKIGIVSIREQVFLKHVS